jgi:sugar (pentulose or hexulose) kinase
VDSNGAPAVPPVAYTTDPGEEFHREFFQCFGDRKELQQTTASPDAGLLLNMAKKIFFIQKTYPEQFKNVESILTFPQYFGFLLTGNKGVEPTYVGSHTHLLDFRTGKYSEVAEKLGVVDKLPSPIAKSWELLGNVSEKVAAETGLSTDCVVTMGIHDSNSSLLPYLVKGYRNFVLNSTGTWCVAMHPTGEVAFEKEELGKLVYYNLDAFFNPVKTTIFMGGTEFETYTTLLKKINGRDDFPPFDAGLYRRILEERKLFILPSVVKGTGLFPDAPAKVMEGDTTWYLEDIQSGKAMPAFFKDYETAYAVLNISLAMQTKIALEMTGFTGGGDVFTEGGFRKNDAYNALMAAMYPDGRNSFTKLEEATAFGAALLGKAALMGSTPMETRDMFDIEVIPVQRPELPDLRDYDQEFRGRIG